MSLVKELTGQEGTIDARNLNEGIVEFKMQAKLFLATNFLPNVDGDDNGILLFLLLSKLMLLISRLLSNIRVVTYWSRKCTPAEVNYPVHEPELLLGEDCELLSFTEIFDPPEVIANTEEYREENNELEVWAKENIVYKARSMLG
ncbi:hypothetical protein HDU92_005982 [Lobulomyces angularis]|nr:hypothetical protein HDU92_005982 [Lobulomyces angularis]